MNDPILKQARLRQLVDERGLYLSANVFLAGRQLGRVWVFLKESELCLAELELPAGLGAALGTVDLRGARLSVRRALVPVALTIETGQGRFEFRGFRGAKEWLAAVEAACAQPPGAV